MGSSNGACPAAGAGGTGRIESLRLRGEAPLGHMAVRAIHDLGLQRRVAHVGFDDLALADVIEPGLTVVAQDPVATGRHAAELVFSRLDGYDGPSRRIELPTVLIERGSGELAPGDGS